jgi:hypothetical protein
LRFAAANAKAVKEEELKEDWSCDRSFKTSKEAEAERGYCFEKSKAKALKTLAQQNIAELAGELIEQNVRHKR